MAASGAAPAQAGRPRLARHLREPGDSAMWRGGKGWQIDMFGWFRRKKSGSQTEIGPVAEAESAPEPLPEGYRVFTTQFDREVLSADLLAELGWNDPGARRDRDLLIAELGAASPSRTKGVFRAMDFQARWRGGHDLGERPLITLLIDHSGSMRGPKALAAAIAADVLGDILQHERIMFEVLGFTTATWQGGLSRALWKDRFWPKFPGRLCDLLHIVYRSIDRPVSSWQRNLILLMDKNALKENIDGEALLWAQQRAMRHNPSGWVCVMMSDGAPVDDSTIQANGGPGDNSYLQRHLEHVIEDFNRQPALRIGCLSLDEPTAPRSSFEFVTQVDVLNDAASRVFDLLEDMIWRKSADDREETIV